MGCLVRINANICKLPKIDESLSNDNFYFSLTVSVDTTLPSSLPKIWQITKRPYAKLLMRGGHRWGRSELGELSVSAPGTSALLNFPALDLYLQLKSSMIVKL